MISGDGWERLLLDDPGAEEFVRTWKRDENLRHEARRIDALMVEARAAVAYAEANGWEYTFDPHTLQVTYVAP